MATKKSEFWYFQSLILKREDTQITKTDHWHLLSISIWPKSDTSDSLSNKEITTFAVLTLLSREKTAHNALSYDDNHSLIWSLCACQMAAILCVTSWGCHSTRDDRLEISDVKFAIQIGSDWPKRGINLGLFKISFSTFWLAKSPRFVPFRANLTLFGC